MKRQLKRRRPFDRKSAGCDDKRKPELISRQKHADKGNNDGRGD